MQPASNTGSVYAHSQSAAFAASFADGVASGAVCFTANLECLATTHWANAPIGALILFDRFLFLIHLKHLVSFMLVCPARLLQRSGASILPLDSIALGHHSRAYSEGD